MEETSKQHKFKDNAIAHRPKVTSYTNTYSFADKKLNLYNSLLRSSVTGDSFSKNIKESNASKSDTKHNSPSAVIPSFIPTSFDFCMNFDTFAGINEEFSIFNFPPYPLIGPPASTWPDVIFATRCPFTFRVGINEALKNELLDDWL